jgi:hypothetical protein
MSSKRLDFSRYSIASLADDLGQSQSVIKLCLQGPRPNVEKGSIEDIKTIDDAQRLMKKAKSRERKRLIAKRWLELCTTTQELHGPFRDLGCLSLYRDDDLRYLQHSRANAFADAAIASREFKDIFHCWEGWYPHGYVADKLLMALLETCQFVEWAFLVIERIETSGRLDSESSQWVYWTFMQRAAELASVHKAKQLLQTILKHKHFDHEKPTVAYLVQKVAEEYRHY